MTRLTDPAERGTALVTGATAGIGAEFARQLAARGMDLVLVARDEARLRASAAQLADRYGVAVDVLVADLTDAEQRATVETRLASSAVQVLVNNAGFGLPLEFDLNAVDDEVRQLDLLATVPLRLTHAVLPQMIERGSGTVITVASLAGYAPLTTYSAAKAWAVVFSRWASAYYRPAGVTITALAPGFVRTEFHERMEITRESMAPRWMWLDVEPLVRTALRDAERGRAVSIPSVRYKLLSLVMGAIPMGLVTANARRTRWSRRG
ncbi:SDR family NAD(P)-dependent oxidoreductase [Schumannella luteola]